MSGGCSADQTEYDRPAVSTGHWGGGAFGGNKEAKVLIQVTIMIFVCLVYIYYYVPVYKCHVVYV